MRTLEVKNPLRYLRTWEEMRNDMGPECPEPISAGDDEGDNDDEEVEEEEEEEEEYFNEFLEYDMY